MKVLILAGGSGTRLFPLSRKSYPKQFLRLDDKTLFQKTIERVLQRCEPEDVFVITNKNHKFLITEQLREISSAFNEFSNIIEEPVGRNTAPAIALGVKFLLDRIKVQDDEVLFVFPSDHIIYPEDKFGEYIDSALKVAGNGFIVTFGISPQKPETGYGYIEVDNNKSLDGIAFKVKRFHEKPDVETAKKYLKQGNFYWNSGMFAFTVGTILKEFEKYYSELYSYILNESYEEFLNSFSELKDISIDYAVMEKSDKIYLIPFNLNWSDVGSWDAIYEIMEKDQEGNVKRGEIIDIDTKDSLIFSTKRLVATIGIKDLLVVETDDAILISKKGESQKVKEIVNRIKKKEETEHITVFHTTVHRPWGSYTELEKGNRYRIKRITVKPGEMLSLQRHYHRSEHWVVVKGTAKVILEDKKTGELKEFFVHENESIYVPKTAKHRLVNPGKIPLEIIEVQVGEYVEEDDIERFEDIYGR